MHQPPPPRIRTGCACPSRADIDGLLPPARHWLAFAIAHGLPPTYAADKALGALALSSRTVSHETEAHGLPRGLLIPTKLVAVARPERQAALAQLKADPVGCRLRLERDPRTGRVGAHAEGHGLIGFLQAKHAWAGPLAGRGAYAVLLQVTGGAPGKPTLGANVAVAGIEGALRACGVAIDGG